MKIHYYLLFVGSVLITGSCAPTTTTWNANTSRTRAFSAHVHAYNNPGSITSPSTYIPSTDWSDSSCTTDYSYTSTSYETDSNVEADTYGPCAGCDGTGTYNAGYGVRATCSGCGGSGRAKEIKPVYSGHSFLIRR